MGFCFSCCRKYDKVPDTTEGEEFQASPGSREGKDAFSNDKDFDQSLKVFQGQEVSLKFSGKRTYDKKFLWIHLPTRTIHMSQYQTKERRHKEANLADVTDVVDGPPEKGADVSTPRHLCLSINFKRGGGIDLMFDTQMERDEWLRVLVKIVARQKEFTQSNLSM